ncbi:MAG: hypothetical protein QM621_05475 [Aeromicrobium sp.]|uniref:hypothetical protein n=1 Tax=Aeromicrobium sp. TaxID=1871063 RepID=UPI0039E51461
MSFWQIFLALLGVLALVVVLLWVFRPELDRGPTPPPTPPVLLSLDDATRAEIDRLVAAGRSVHAIKLLLDRTGLSLKEAKDAVESGSYRTGASGEPPRPPSVADRDLAIGARAVCEASGPIAAVTYVREHTGWGLAEAKAYVDRLG